MTTTVYTPPQLPVTTRIYGLPTDDTGSEIYEPADVLFAGDLHIAGTVPTVAVA